MSVPAAFSLRLRGTSQCPLIARHLFYHSAPCCLHMASVGIFRPCVYYHVTLMLKLLQFLCLVNLMVKFEFPVVAYNKEQGGWTLHAFPFSTFTTSPNICPPFSHTHYIWLPEPARLDFSDRVSRLA